MSSLITSLILASLLLPLGFNFFTASEISNFGGTSFSVVNTKSIVPKRLANNSFGVKTTADNILVVDGRSNAVLYNKEFLRQAPIASITKLMTALVILDAQPDWNKVVTMEARDQKIGGQVYLLTGEQVTMQTLFNLMLMASSNEAAAALARTSGIEDFPARMNAKAVALGMNDTNFVEPTGLDKNNISTPNDLVILANNAFAKSEISTAVKIKDYYFTVINGGRQGHSVNTDELLNSFLESDEYSIIGAKTGYLEEAGYCLLLSVKRHDGTVVTLVLLGADTMEDRWQESKGLIDWVYRSYAWPE